MWSFDNFFSYTKAKFLNLSTMGISDWMIVCVYMCAHTHGHTVCVLYDV